MNQLEKKMVNTLINLKENHHVTGVKAEFETEGTRFDEALRLKDIVMHAGLELTIKIGGCEAKKDMFDARTIGVDTIVAPMIETEYAMQKFVKATKLVFPKEEREDKKFFVNIETITGFRNLDKIIESPFFEDLDGVVLGRDDMSCSLGLTTDEVNGEEIFEIAEVIATKVHHKGKDLVIGGGVSADSIPFFNRLKANCLTRFETRKVIFDAQKALKNSDAQKGILKALGFELMWLRNKREFYKMIFEEDAQRIALLESRHNKLIEAAGEVYA